MEPQREQQIARGLRNGDVSAWQQMYDAFAERVWRAVARWVGPHSAEIADVVQETFLAASRSARNYDENRGSLWQWLSGIARNHTALSFRKRQSRERVAPIRDGLREHESRAIDWLESREATPAESSLSTELAALVRSTLARLPTDYSVLLCAKYFDGTSIDDIAGAENSTATAVRSKLARARRAFRERFLDLTSGAKAAAPH